MALEGWVLLERGRAAEARAAFARAERRAALEGESDLAEVEFGAALAAAALQPDAREAWGPQLRSALTRWPEHRAADRARRLVE